MPEQKSTACLWKFIRQWKDHYPEASKWYELKTSKYMEDTDTIVTLQRIVKSRLDEKSVKSIPEIMGAHPWEICRGGNSTHISLMITYRGDEWVLILSGSSIVRVEKTARMAAALHKNNIPFILHDSEKILRMVNGTDDIGIVPDHVTPLYCQSLFPKNE